MLPRNRSCYFESIANQDPRSISKVATTSLLCRFPGIESVEIRCENFASRNVRAIQQKSPAQPGFL